jgi:tetraprenyl-beta-curcumene synthase
MGGCPGPHAHFGQGGPIVQQLSERLPESAWIARRHDSRRARACDLRKAAHVAEQQGLTERERREQHARLVGLQVGEHDEVGPFEIGRQLVVGNESWVEPDAGGSRCTQSRDVHLRHPGYPQLRIANRRFARSCSAPRVQQHVDALVGTHEAEHQHHGLLRLVRWGRWGRPRCAFGQMGKHTVWDHVHAVTIGAELLDEAVAAVLGVDHDRVEAVVQAPLRRELPGARLAREHVVGGEHERAAHGARGAVGSLSKVTPTARGETGSPSIATATARGAGGRQQVGVKRLDGEPLEVHHVGVTRHTAVAQHVGHVLGELARHPHTPSGSAARGAVEQLASHIPVWRRHGSVRKAARHQLHIRPSDAQRTAERMVVGWGIGGGIDYLNAHQGETIRPATHSRVALAATFTHAALSYWLTVFPRVCFHIVRWRRLARRIPDPELRELALEALAKRGNIEGAAAFAAFVPRSCRAEVTRAVSSFQAAYNFLDMLGEQPSADPVTDGRRLHEALLYALTPPRGAGGAPRGEEDPHATPLDWYEHHPRHEDGGYLMNVLNSCRTAVAGLPSYETVAPAARAAAARIMAFQSLNLSESQGNHEALEQWAREASPPGAGLQWWETAAAAGSSLGVFVLIAAAAETQLDAGEVAALEYAYFPWIGGLHSLLDNLIDKREDEAAGHRSLVEYYGPQRAAQRMRWLAQEAMRVAQELPHSRRHFVILAAMIGNYLSTPEAHSPELEPISESVLATVGELEKPTMLVFKLRRLPTRLRNAVVYRRTRAHDHAPPRLDSFR